MLVRNDFRGKTGGVSHASSACPPFFFFDAHSLSDRGCLYLLGQLELALYFCNPIYLPPTSLAFFVSSWRVHLDLQTLYVPFLFHWLFPLMSYLVLALFLPRSQIKQLGTLFSLPNY
jgi:hypothetical protein